MIRVKHALYGPWWKGDVLQEGPPPPGILHGDSLSGDPRDPQTLVGIVDLTNRTRYGFSSRGIPQYLFHPLDTRFPPMIVGSKAPTTANQWGVITTKDLVWKSKWPTVHLQQLLGPVGDPAVEVDARLRRYLRGVPRTKIDSFDASLPPFEEWEVCFNIDPAGCRDVDDVIAWRNQGDVLEFAIAIAYVAAAVPPGSPLDLQAQALGQTLYREGTVVHSMLPANLSEDACSLLADGKPRGVVAAVWRISDKVEGPTWRTFSLCNKATFTYESVLDHPIAQELPRHLSRIVGDVGTDPHHWIEAAMIAYNHAAAQKLLAEGKGILRCHVGIAAPEWQALASQTGQPELAFLGASAGTYTHPSENCGHAGLSLSVYCHASSPLRRYADLVNQRILVSLQETLVNPEQLNERAKEAKRFERDCWFLSHLSAEELRQAKGFLISHKDSLPLWKYKVYVPEWRRCITVRSDNPDFQQLVPGMPVEITAYWDRRGLPETCFVFRMCVVSQCVPSEVPVLPHNP